LASVPLSNNYEPFWQQQWNERQSFNPDRVQADGSKAFSMILPPPNVTGDLHLGHALTVAVEDAMFRFTQMQSPNRKCVFVPGFDHAGIATQAVLDRRLWARKGKRVYDLTQDEFQQEAERWKHERITSIREQLNQLGAALDYGRETYTLDDRITKAVNHAFVRLFDQGLLYRTETIVNWCFAMNSTVSDLEVKWQTIERPTRLRFPGHERDVTFGYLYDLAYRLEDGSGELIVSTTRPYSLPADVAIAVNPNDARYAQFVGRHVIHPLTNGRLPIVADDHVRVDLGSGAVKVTPSASIADFEMATRHQLPIGSLLNGNGALAVSNLSEQYQSLNGTNRFEANDRVLSILTELGLFRGRRPHQNVIPLCSRTNDLIEYRVLPQWFLNMKPFNSELREQLNRNEIDFEPASYKNALLDWISHERDWCVSRQIWWGHRVPVYSVQYADGRQKWIAAVDRSEADRKAAEDANRTTFTVTASSDVLDTWFSSALLPFAVFGWPDQTDDLRAFYPISLIETGFDILKFWVHKMMAMGWYLTDRLPFQRILLHGMIVDANGKKMSKSVGNVVNPSDIINGASSEQLQQQLEQLHRDGYMTAEELASAAKNQRRLFPDGLPSNTADGLRLCLYQYDLHSEVIKLDKDNVKHNRNLINKVWQSFQLFRLLIDRHRLTNESAPFEWTVTQRHLDRRWTELSWLDKWILGRLAEFVDASNYNLSRNHFHIVYRDFHEFWLENFCSTYLELIKPSFQGTDVDSRLNADRLHVFAYCLQNALLAMHPMIPFVSEELFQRLEQIVSSQTFSGDTFRSLSSRAFPFMVVSPKCMNTADELKRTFQAIQFGASEIRSVKNRLAIGKANGLHFRFQVRTAKLHRCSDLDGGSMLQILTRTDQVRFVADGLLDVPNSIQERHHFVNDNQLVIHCPIEGVQVLLSGDQSSGQQLFDLYDRSMTKSSEKKSKKGDRSLATKV
jgi:valyl-tRNA synthetase